MSRWIWRMVTGLVLAALAAVPVRGLASVDGASATVDRRIAITFDDLPWVMLRDDWLDAGFELGNHTRWHSDLNAVGVKAFEREILDGEHLLRPLLDMRGL